MGIISDLANRNKSFRSPTDSGLGRNLWQQTFGTTKETGGNDKLRPLPRQSIAPAPGGSFGRSAMASAAFVRLLTAMRSQAPGGWSDDKWEQTKHFVGVQYISIHRKCEQLSQAEFQVFRKDLKHPDGKRPITEDDEAWDLVKLLEHPNEEDGFGDLLYNWGLQMDLTGMSLTWTVPNQMGKPFELYSIPTATALPQPAVNPDFPDGYYRIQPVYPYGPFSSYPSPASAVGAPIPSQWMMRIKYPHPFLRYEGYSPYSALRLHIDEVEGIDRSRWYNMKRIFNPNVVLNMDQVEGSEPLPEAEIDRIKSEIENAFFGPENVGNLFVPPPGGKLEEFGSTPDKMMYESGWDQLTSFVMGGLGITKQAAGMIEDSSYSTLFATLKQLHLLTLEPMCARIARRLTRFLGKFWGDDLIVEIRCPRIDDHDVKNAKLSILVGAKALTVNELRKELDMELTEEEWGNERVGEEPQQEEGAMPGMEGAEGMPEPPPLEDADTKPEPPALEEDNGDEQEERPTPDGLGDGSLGPRKSMAVRNRLEQFAQMNRTKSLYEQVLAGLTNGNGNGHSH